MQLLQVVSLVGAQKASLHPDDMLLLANFILSSESFRYMKKCILLCSAHIQDLPNFGSLMVLLFLRFAGHRNPSHQFVCQDITLWRFYMHMSIILM